MRLLLTALVPMLLLPAASAEPAAEVTLLEGRAGCASHEAWWSHQSGNSTPEGGYVQSESGYVFARSCEDDFDYARASAGDVSVGASARHDNASRSDGSSQDAHAWGNESSWSQRWSQYSYASSDDWDRTVSAQAGDDRVAVSRGCSTSWEGGGSRSSSDQPWSSSSTDDQRSSSANRCEQAAANSSLTGEAAVADGCRSDDSSSRRTYSSESYDDSWQQWSASSRCETGVEAAGISAGAGSGCSGDGSVYSVNDGETMTYNASRDTQRCESGLFARGPDEATLFVGERRSAWTYCDQGACESSDESGAGAQLAWEHNPLGPGVWGPWFVLP